MNKSYLNTLAALPAKLVLLLVRIYQLCISPMIVPSCRFIPTCSEYAAEALQTHGLLRGSLLTVWRLLRCHPLCRGGYDPVRKASNTAHRKGAF